MGIDVQTLASPMLNALKQVLDKYWGEVQDFAKTEALKMAQTLANIASLKAAGKINEAQAAALVDMQKQSMQAVLLAFEGIGLIAAQAAINAALAAVKDTVNKLLGFGLL
jgi:hypothetical protein